MFSIISIILLIASIKCIHYGIEWFGVLLFASAAFAVAGAIGSVSSRLGDLYLTTIKKKDQLDGSTEINFEKQVPNVQNNQH
jgi:hypothetical protein